MAQALAAGIVRAGLCPATSITAADPVSSARQRFEQLVPGGRTVDNNGAILEKPRIIFLAVKPQQLPAVCRQVAAHASSTPIGEHLFVSIVAGVPLASLSEGLGTDRVVRVMPNTPCLIGAGASGYACAPAVVADEQQVVQKLLETVGIAYRLAEVALDAVTGLSGSGPAYVYELIEAMADAGVQGGLARDVALSLAAQTVFGSARMVLESGEHPATLKDRVTSPGGTTIAGLHALHQGGFRGLVMTAIQAATKRSRELGQSADGSGLSTID
jgi:pyrroline-5-carboxylate reductase